MIPGRVYIRRQGRMTKAQAAALRDHLAHYQIVPTGRFAPCDAFARGGPIALEIGFGMGQGLIEFARAHPHFNCIGAEVYRPGIGSLVAALDREGLTNVRVFEGDARALVESIAPASITRVMVYFPDPWPKKRHHKRRLVEPRFVESLATILAHDGDLLLATDWEDYALEMLAVLDAQPMLENVAGTGAFSPRPDDRPLTRFESRGLKLGHRVWDLIYRKAATTESR